MLRIRDIVNIKRIPTAELHDIREECRQVYIDGSNPRRSSAAKGEMDIIDKELRRRENPNGDPPGYPKRKNWHLPDDD